MRRPPFRRGSNLGSRRLLFGDHRRAEPHFAHRRKVPETRNVWHQRPADINANFGDGSIYNGDHPWVVSRVAGVTSPLAQGIGDSFVSQFGSWHPGICQFVMADGSVRACRSRSIPRCWAICRSATMGGSCPIGEPRARKPGGGALPKYQPIHPRAYARGSPTDFLASAINFLRGGFGRRLGDEAHDRLGVAAAPHAASGRANRGADRRDGSAAESEKWRSGRRESGGQAARVATSSLRRSHIAVARRPGG